MIVEAAAPLDAAILAAQSLNDWMDVRETNYMTTEEGAQAFSTGTYAFIVTLWTDPKPEGRVLSDAVGSEQHEET